MVVVKRGSVVRSFLGSGVVAGIVTVCDKVESKLRKELLTFLTGSRASAMLLE